MPKQLFRFITLPIFRKISIESQVFPGRGASLIKKKKETRTFQAANCCRNDLVSPYILYEKTKSQRNKINCLRSSSESWWLQRNKPYPPTPSSMFLSLNHKTRKNLHPAYTGILFLSLSLSLLFPPSLTHAYTHNSKLQWTYKYNWSHILCAEFLLILTEKDMRNTLRCRIYLISRVQVHLVITN